MGIEQWSKDLTEEYFGASPFSVGDDVRHPSGRMVRIIDGQYWGTHGLSNHWHWREISPDGSLSDVRESGYGWSASSGRER
jgi:hypothetical protein